MWNIILILIITFTTSLAFSVTYGLFYYIYIDQITNSSITLGLIVAMYGATQLFMVFFMIKFGKYDNFIKWTFVPGAFTIAANLLSLTDFNNDVIIVFLFVSNALAGCFFGLRNPWLQTIFPRDVRRVSPDSYWFSTKWMIDQLGSIMGPIISLLFLLCISQDNNNVKTILNIGWFIFIVPIFLIFALKFQTIEYQDSLINQENQNSLSLTLTCGSQSRKIRWILIITDLIFMFGAGMSVAYLPLFLKLEWEMSTITLSIIYVLYSIINSIFTKLCDITSRNIGPKWTLFLFRFSGTLLSLFLAVTYYWHSRSDLSRVILSIVCILRSGFFNSTSGISSSLLMDHTPDHSRSKWNAVECINSATWAGSSVLGGVIIWWKGYYVCFLITAVVYFIGCLGILQIP